VDLRGICLITPPSPFLLDERVFMHLGILKVASVLKAAGHYVESLDLSGYRNYVDAVKDHAANTDVCHFGITATTPQFPAAVKVASTIREVRKDARIIIGGPHVTLVNAAKKREVSQGNPGRACRAYQTIWDEFDVLVAGDGEEAIFHALAADPPKLIDADDRRSPLWQSDMKLHASPFPARDLVDVRSYHYTIDDVPALSLIAQLGCPYKCGFCAGRNSPMLRHIRTRSTENIIEEMLHLYQTYGTRGFMFYDDELNISKTMVELMDAIAKAQRDLRTEWHLRGFVKSERLTDEQAEAMYKAGFRWLLVGFESGSPRILENIQKIATQEDNTRCMDISRRHGLKVKALMSVGHPGESQESVRETHDWLLDVSPEDFDATIITPYPGSPYYDEAQPTKRKGIWVYTARSGDQLYQEEIDYTVDADYYKGDPNDGYVSHVFTSSLSPIELVNERDQLERDVRKALGIPFNPSAPALLYEHSMGQSALPARILRISDARTHLS
jgi:anaerobic magnesium-protoporphyrin IX monomethyl ester cyclase